jgi:hypothetical protein
MVRLLRLAIYLGLALIGLASSGRAQTFTDPFTAYYGFVLPRQAALALAPRPINTINDMAAIRQRNAITDRAGLYDPIQPFGSGYDPSNPFGERSSNRRRTGGLATRGMTIAGGGVQGYHKNTQSYYPKIRTGRGVNANSSIAAGLTRRPAVQFNSRANGAGGMGMMGGMGGMW